MKDCFAYCLGALLLMFVFVVTGCQDDAPTAPDDNVLPAPQTISADAIAAPVDRLPEADDPAALYYLLFDGRTEAAKEAAENGAAPLLEDLLARDFDLKKAWHPIVSSVVVPCGVPNAHAALVVELDAPDAAIKHLGFVRDPRPNTPNCGIELFDYYAFE